MRTNIYNFQIAQESQRHARAKKKIKKNSKKKKINKCASQLLIKTREIDENVRSSLNERGKKKDRSATLISHVARYDLNEYYTFMYVNIYVRTYVRTYVCRCEAQTM